MAAELYASREVENVNRSVQACQGIINCQSAVNMSDVGWHYIMEIILQFSLYKVHA